MFLYYWIYCIYFVTVEIYSFHIRSSYFLTPELAVTIIYGRRFFVFKKQARETWMGSCFLPSVLNTGSPSPTVSLNSLKYTRWHGCTLDPITGTWSSTPIQIVVISKMCTLPGSWEGQTAGPTTSPFAASWHFTSLAWRDGSRMVWKESQLLNA